MFKCECGIPQGSCLFFVNYLETSTNFCTLLFADDCSFQIFGVNTPDLFRRANEEFRNEENWFSANKLTIDTKKKIIFCIKVNINMSMQIICSLVTML